MIPEKEAPEKMNEILQSGFSPHLTQAKQREKKRNFPGIFFVNQNNNHCC